jgi:hypothetical protein
MVFCPNTHSVFGFLQGFCSETHRVSEQETKYFKSTWVKGLVLCGSYPKTRF